MKIVYCPECGKKSPDPTAKFCMSCGYSFFKKASIPKPEATPAPRLFGSKSGKNYNYDPEDGIDVQEFNLEIDELEFEADFSQNKPQSLGSIMKNPMPYSPQDPESKNHNISEESFIEEYRKESGFKTRGQSPSEIE